MLTVQSLMSTYVYVNIYIHMYTYLRIYIYKNT